MRDIIEFVHGCALETSTVVARLLNVTTSDHPLNVAIVPHSRRAESTYVGAVHIALVSSHFHTNGERIFLDFRTGTTKVRLSI